LNPKLDHPDHQRNTGTNLNHLGNVLATITDRRTQICGAGEVIYYSAQVVTISDYYPFGMQMDSRVWAGTETTDTVTVVEDVASFEGSDARLDLTNITSSIAGDITVEFWFKRSTMPSSTTEMIYDDAHNASGGLLVYLQNNQLKFWGLNKSGHGGLYYTYTGTVTDGEWHHVVFTASGTQWKFYVDNVLVQTKTGPSGTTSFGNDLDIRLGARRGADPAQYAYEGSIRQLGVWKVARISSQIAASYNDEVITRGFGLLGYWKLNTGQGDAATNEITGVSDTADVSLSWETHSYTSIVKSGHKYRFGFNGKEKDDEGMGGGGPTYDYGFRIYNPALGRFLSVDPLTASYPWNSPYSFAENDVISSKDLDGLERLNMTVTRDPNSENGNPGVTHIKISIQYNVVTSGEHAVGNRDLINPAEIRSLAALGNTVLFLSKLPGLDENGNPTSAVQLEGKELKLAQKFYNANSMKKSDKLQTELQQNQINFYITHVTYDVQVNVNDNVTYQDAQSLRQQGRRNEVGIIRTPGPGSITAQKFDADRTSPEMSTGGTITNIISLSRHWYGPTITNQKFENASGALTPTGEATDFSTSDEVIVHGFGHNSGAVLEHVGSDDYNYKGLQSNQRDRIFPTNRNTMKILNNAINQKTMDTFDETDD